MYCPQVETEISREGSAGGGSLPASDLNRALSLCAGGDRSALRAIYDSEAPRMLGVAMRLLRRRALAEEAVHDPFLQIWRKADSFDPMKGDARSWLYAILRNRALNILRGENRTDLVEDFEPMGLVERGGGRRDRDAAAVRYGPPEGLPGAPGAFAAPGHHARLYPRPQPRRARRTPRRAPRHDQVVDPPRPDLPAECMA